MSEVSSSYGEAQLALLLRALSSDGSYPRVAADLALVLHHTDCQTVPTTLVTELAQAVLASVAPQRAVNHLLRYLDTVPEAAVFWTAVARHPKAFVELVQVFAG